jgi:hypothetical protein
MRKTVAGSLAPSMPDFPVSFVETLQPTAAQQK